MRDFRKLNGWEKAHRLTLQVYESTKSFPSDERFGLTIQHRIVWSQMRLPWIF